MLIQNTGFVLNANVNSYALLAASEFVASLASLYINQQRWKEAEELFGQEIQIRMRVLGWKHPATLATIASFALIYSNQGKLKEAEKLFIHVMTTRMSVLGKQHSDTLNSMAGFASIYSNQGKLKEAEEFFMLVMEMKKGVLAKNHPDILSSMASLATIYAKQERWKEAEELLLQVTKTRVRVLGNEHPDVLSSMISIANMHKIQHGTGMFKTVVVVDDTASMIQNINYNDNNKRTRWDVTREALCYMIESLFRYSSNGLDIRFLKAFHYNTDNVTTDDDAKKIFERIDLTKDSHSGGTFLCDELHSVIDPYLGEYEDYKEELNEVGNRRPLQSPKPLNLVIITDGEADDQLDLEDYIVSVALKLDELSASMNFIPISVVLIGDDEAAAIWLMRLNDKLRIQDPPIQDVSSAFDS